MHPTPLTLKGEEELPRCIERIDRKAPAAWVMGTISLREGWFRLWREDVSRVDWLSVCSPEAPISESDLMAGFLCTLEIKHTALLLPSIFSTQGECAKSSRGGRGSLTLLIASSCRGSAHLGRCWRRLVGRGGISLGPLSARRGDPKCNQEQ